MKEWKYEAWRWPSVQTTRLGWRGCSRGWGCCSHRTELEDCGTSAAIPTLPTRWTPSGQTCSAPGVCRCPPARWPLRSRCSGPGNIREAEDKTSGFIKAQNFLQWPSRWAADALILQLCLGWTLLNLDHNCHKNLVSISWWLTVLKLEKLQHYWY